jgi:hypothetical protein
MKKEATPKHKGLRKKTSDEKRGNPKMQGAKYKTFAIRKNKQDHQFTKASYTDLTVKGEGDTFRSGKHRT